MESSYILLYQHWNYHYLVFMCKVLYKLFHTFWTVCSQYIIITLRFAKIRFTILTKPALLLYTSATVSKSIGQVLQCSRHIHKWQCTLIHSVYIHTPYNNIYIWPHNHPCHKETIETTYQACAHTHCSFHWCNFVLKNKEQSIYITFKKFSVIYNREAYRHGRNNLILNVCGILMWFAMNFIVCNLWNTVQCNVR